MLRLRLAVSRPNEYSYSLFQRFFFFKRVVLYSFSDGVCIYAWRRFPFPLWDFFFRFVSTGFIASCIDLGISSERFYVFLLLLMMFDEEKRIERRCRRSNQCNVGSSRDVRIRHEMRREMHMGKASGIEYPFGVL